MGFSMTQFTCEFGQRYGQRFLLKKMHFRKKAPVDVFKVFFHVKRDPVRRTFYDGNVQLIKHYFL